ncbi:MAG: hypothetical protein AB1330_01820 [Bacillota bacterium]
MRKIMLTAREKEYILRCFMLSFEMQRLIACSKTAPPGLLTKMAHALEKPIERYPDKHVLLSLVSNPSLPEETLRYLFESYKGAVEVRRELAGNEKTPPDILEKFVADPALTVRLALARNPAAPPEILAEIYQRIARTRASRAIYVDILATLASNPACTEEVLMGIVLTYGGRTDFMRAVNAARYHLKERRKEGGEADAV